MAQPQLYVALKRYIAINTASLFPEYRHCFNYMQSPIRRKCVQRVDGNIHPSLKHHKK